jgi:hypothetical protein
VLVEPFEVVQRLDIRLRVHGADAGRQQNQPDWTRFADLLAEHVVYEAPQTREQVRGQLDDDRITRITDFWPDPYELPARRAHLVERY